MIHYSEAPEAVKLLEEAKRHKQTKNWTQTSNDIEIQKFEQIGF